MANAAKLPLKVRWYVHVVLTPTMTHQQQNLSVGLFLAVYAAVLNAYYTTGSMPMHKLLAHTGIRPHKVRRPEITMFSVITNYHFKV